MHHLRDALLDRPKRCLPTADSCVIHSAFRERARRHLLAEAFEVGRDLREQEQASALFSMKKSACTIPWRAMLYVISQ
jgi:hypothetical protein